LTKSSPASAENCVGFRCHGDFPHRHAGGAGPGELAFLANPKYRHQLATTRAAAVIMAPPALPRARRRLILTPQPYLYYARVAQWLNPVPVPAPGVHPSAVVEGDVAPVPA
jgi:UDP-3-O-[3-hydroxymyristoyl] glucosamine N-acyltransferase